MKGKTHFWKGRIEINMLETFCLLKVIPVELFKICFPFLSFPTRFQKKIKGSFGKSISCPEPKNPLIKSLDSQEFIIVFATIRNNILMSKSPNLCQNVHLLQIFQQHLKLKTLFVHCFSEKLSSINSLALSG